MTEREKIIEVIDEWANKAVKANKFDGASVYNPHNAAELAGALIKAGVGAVEEIKKEAEYWENEAKTARADIDDAVEEITKRIFSELRDYFVEQSAYAADCNQHTGYYDYEIKASDVVCDIVTIAEKYGVELGAKDDD